MTCNLKWVPNHDEGLMFISFTLSLCQRKEQNVGKPTMDSDSLEHNTFGTEAEHLTPRLPKPNMTWNVYFSEVHIFLNYFICFLCTLLFIIADNEFVAQELNAQQVLPYTVINYFFLISRRFFFFCNECCKFNDIWMFCYDEPFWEI